MILISVLVALSLIGLNAAYRRYFYFKSPKAVIKILNEAQLIYADDSTRKSKIFSNLKYHIKAKPDFIYHLNGEYILIEYKSRYGKVYQSDVAQLIATALAVKPTYPKLTKGFVYTQSGQYSEINLNVREEVLFEQIRQEVTLAHAITQYRAFSFQSKDYKCRVCSYRYGCTFRADKKKAYLR